MKSCLKETYDAPRTFKYELLRESGTTVHIEMRCIPKPDRGTDRGIFVFLSDSTLKDRMEDQLYHDQVMESFGFLASGITHDFNNVINSVSVAAQILEERLKTDNQEALELISIISRASDRAKNLTDSLKMFIHKGEPSEKDISLGNVIDDVIRILSLNLKKNILIQKDQSSHQDMIMGIPSEIQNLLINLGINAIQAIEDAGEISFRLKNIHVRADDFGPLPSILTPGEYCCIEVEDSGCGIPAENMNKIFKPFYTTKGRQTGTGLGLAMVHKTVSDHRGWIGVESAPGKGTVFTLLFPLSPWQQTSLTPELKPKMGEGLILLIDDETINCRLGSSILESLGYKVITAESGRDALRIYEEKGDKIDLVLLDLVMPEMDGYEVFEAIKGIREDAKIIILSGYIENDKLARIKTLGVEEIIIKPYSIPEISKKIRNALLKKTC